MTANLNPRRVVGVLVMVWLTGPTGEVSGQELQAQQDHARWEAAIKGEGEWDDLAGTAEVIFVIGASSFSADVSFVDDEAGALRPWHVHEGTCTESGRVVGGASSYPALDVGSGGTSTESTTVPVALDPSAPYHVNIHRSPTEIGTIVACGELIRQP